MQPQKLMPTQWKATFAIMAVVLLLGSAYVNYHATKFRHVAHADAAGYYLWLPATCIYGDSKFAFADTVFRKCEFYGAGTFNTTLVDVSTGGKMNKYAPGAALSALPVFQFAHIYGIITGQAAGFEIHYQISWWLAAMLFVVIGLWFLFKLAFISQKSLLFTTGICVLIVFGTNLFHYASWDAGYSHAFTFGWMAMALFFLAKTASTKNKSGLFLAAFALGMLVLVRPFNLLMVPVICTAAISPFRWLELFREKFTQVAYSVLIFIIPVFLLLLSNYWQSGHWFVYSYGHEKFVWNESHFWDFLFGFKIGAFVYSPALLMIILLSIGAMIYNRVFINAFVLITGFVAITYILSCWSTWTFGCTLGNRPLTDWYALWVFPLLSWKLPSIRKLRIPAVLIGTVFIIYNQVLHYQYRNWILNWCDMDKEKYFDVFMKTDQAYRFYTYDDWDFSYIKNDSVEHAFLGDFKEPVKKNRQTIFRVDSLMMQPGRRYRMRFHCQMRWTNSSGEDKMSVNITAGGIYHDYLQKFIKKSIRSGKGWQKFTYEFLVRQTDKPLSAEFVVIDHDGDELNVKDCVLEWISWLPADE